MRIRWRRDDGEQRRGSCTCWHGCKCKLLQRCKCVRLPAIRLLECMPAVHADVQLYVTSPRPDRVHTAHDVTCTQARVWRGGRHLDVQVVLRVRQELVSAHSHDVRPEYYIYAGVWMFMFVWAWMWGPLSTTARARAAQGALSRHAHSFTTHTTHICRPHVHAPQLLLPQEPVRR